MNSIYTKIFISLILSLMAFSLKAENSYIKLNYGLSSNEIDATAASGSISTDDEDLGFIISGGTLIGNNWGIDLMYYDMGDSSITVTQDDILTVNGADFAIYAPGDINRNVTGFGAGFIASSNNESDFLGTDFYLKIGMHAWSKDGSTTLTDGNDAFNSKYYNEGIGAYAGAGLSINLIESTSIDFAYDIIGVSSNGDFDNGSSLLSAGVKVKF